MLPRQRLRVFENRLYFTASTGNDSTGRELYKTDGTAQKTELVKEINPGMGDGATGMQLTVLDTSFFFFADDGNTGLELWTSDGTSGGTSLVKDINLNEDGASRPHCRVLFRSWVIPSFSSGKDTTHGIELWKSDGTTDGTQMVKNIHATGDAWPGELTPTASGALYFSADDSMHGYELWKTNGKPHPDAA